MTTQQLLAAYWLDGEHDENPFVKQLERLKQLRDDKIAGVTHPDVGAVPHAKQRLLLQQYAQQKRYSVSDIQLDEAADHLTGRLVQGDAEQWVVCVCYWGHPNATWNVMMDALMLAENDDHLVTIARGPAEHLLSYYGSMVPRFVNRSRRDPCFKRMLTGVWRHRMSDRVWSRLRVIQLEVADPLPGGPHKVLEHGRSLDTIREEDRGTDDKGRYRLNADGCWDVPGRDRVH